MSWDWELDRIRLERQEERELTREFGRSYASSSWRYPHGNSGSTGISELRQIENKLVRKAVKEEYKTYEALLEIVQGVITKEIKVKDLRHRVLKRINNNLK